VRFSARSIRNEHQVELSYTWVKLALQGAGLVQRDGNAGAIATTNRVVRCRAMLPCTSMAAPSLVPGLSAVHDLIVILDDAAARSILRQLSGRRIDGNGDGGTERSVQRKGYFGAL